MSKEILIYGGIYDFTVGSFMREMEDAKDEDIVLRINTNGGDPQSSFGVLSKFQEHSKSKTLRVDGKAYSTGALMCCYADHVIALDVSEFLIHRVAFPEYFENDANLFTPDVEASLKYSNDKARAAIESKVDVEKFERVTGVTLDQIFSMDGRIDVYLTSDQAKKVGLVDEIRSITPELRTDIMHHMEASQLKAAAHLGIQKPVKENTDKKIFNTKKVMDINTLKAEHPALYAQVAEVESAKGASKERDRIGSFMVYADVDLKSVQEGIESGKAMSGVQMAEFGRKLASRDFVKRAEVDSAAELETTADLSDLNEDKEALAKKAEIDKFEKEMYANLGLKKS